MFTATKIESTIRPKKFESLNNGTWYYNYDIESRVVQVQSPDSEEIVDETIYSFIQVRISGKPTYDKCVKAIIKQYVNTDDEFDLINSYNSYQLDIESIDPKYEEYLQLVKVIKDNVRKDFEMEKEVSVLSTPKQADIVKLMMMTINTMSLSDQQALSVKSLYPNWEEFIGVTIKINTKVQYGGKLFKVMQEHLVQSNYPPSINTASLYTEIVEDHTGTIDDPIPYPSDGNIIIYKDKYYIEDGVIYKCIRNSEQPLYSKLSALVGNYVEEVDTLF